MPAFSDYVICERASTGYAQTVAGDWVEFAANTLRRTDKGLLIECARTNYLLNSGAPVTQTTASLATGTYCLWVEGTGSALASAGTATITGAASATEGSPDVFTVTVAGTVTVTVTGSLDRFQLEDSEYPTSYILTTSVAVTRAADVVLLIGLAATTIDGAAVSAVVSIDVVPIAAQFTALADPLVGYPIFSQSDTSVAHYGSAIVAKTGLASLLTTASKLGAAWDGSGFSVTGQGLTPATSAAPPVNYGTIYLGSDAVNPTNFMDSYIRRLSLWNTRISDAELQSRTA